MASDGPDRRPSAAKSSTFVARPGDALEVSGGTTIGSGGLDFDSISAAGATNGVLIDGDGDAGQGAVTIDGGTIADTTGDAIDVYDVPTLAVSGVTVDGSGGNGLGLFDSDGSFDATVSSSTIDGVASGDAVDAQAEGDGNLTLTLQGNPTLATDSGDSGSALAVTGDDDSTVCLDATGNGITGGGGTGTAVDLEQAGEGSLGVAGYTGEDLTTYLEQSPELNLLSGSVPPVLSTGTIGPCDVGLE